MSQYNIASNMSSLSLDPSVGTPTTKKHKRPTRAFHNFGLPGSAAESPTATPTLNHQESFTGTPQIGTFAPRHFSVSETVAGATDQYTVSSPYLASNPELSPPNATSHFVPMQRLEEQIKYLSCVFETTKNSVPPLPTTQFYCADQGSCDPRLMNLSMYNIPEDNHLRSATKLPLGLTVQPFAKLIPDEPIPLVGNASSSEIPPLRCKRCRAYANPGFHFQYDSKVVCNICKVEMQIPNEHILNAEGLRVDFNTSIELARGAVDFLAPKSYNATDAAPLPLHYAFLIDVSTHANENGSSLAVLEAVRETIEYIRENQTECKIGIIAYDNKLRFYNLRSELQLAQEYIVTELDDCFLPFYEGLFVKPENSMTVINDTLAKIGDFIRNDKYNHSPYNCYGSALQAAQLALNIVTGRQGGKIIASLNSLPNIGNGNLYIRKDDATKRTLKCDNEFYVKLSEKLLRSYISVDLFVTSSAFVEMVSVGRPVLVTNGILKYYPQFRGDAYSTAVAADMVQNVSNIIGYQALMKVRCSAGLSVNQYYSESVDYTDRDPMIPVLTRDTTIDVLLKYDEKLKVGTDMSFQTAVLYTDLNGIRKIRSINCTGGVSNNIREVFKFIDQNSVMRIMINDILRTLGDCDFPKIRQIIDDKIVDILTQYRGLVNGNSASQLVLPDSLKTLPTYMLCFEKSELMKPNNQSTRGNNRINDLMKYSTLNSAQLSFKLYPQIIPFHVLLEETDLTFYDANDKLLQIQPTSKDSLSVLDGFGNLLDGGCYFIFDGETVYLWFNHNTNKMLLEDLLGVDPTLNINQITLFGGCLPETGTEINQKAFNVIKNWCQIVGKTSLPLVLLRPGVDNYCSEVLGHVLVEDKTVNMVDSTSNYFITLHSKIQAKLNKQDFIKISTPTTRTTDTLHQDFVQF
ncbi:Sfb3p NDAI_0C01730 [Naumovozyma dairenensis CBS 421]|uniref:VWFA domain-containing protein n=1 Tax=Naumovozyma dairenensis (strain ATCC 10597 / BCRC 20456 / CBS 421 / NBRC 0211 / NRRL Y-12639) TaxID=1071378 RepID=G0W7S3_NAUDC|nr:hypothetical protein NDAI_0C01730 [Naumovozyma dairenensis CBS 421]CCD23834.1 hypothetical protein NDAI_0C01730 [Naumovozyma dairenensis CBS 421]